MVLAALQEPEPVHYLPIATTVISAVFATVLFRRLVRKGGGAPHLLWWGLGVVFFGLGTALESCITLFGNSPLLNKLWYVAGALFGAWPLAQGTVYLLLRRSTADTLTRIVLPLTSILALVVLFSPIDPALLEAHRPGGAALEWSWVRLFTPFINLYAAVFLIGGAAWSSWRYARRREFPGLAAGNALIATGAILPGIGGGMAKAGMVEALYVGEFVGILLIWAGYGLCTRPSGPAGA